MKFKYKDYVRGTHEFFGSFTGVLTDYSNYREFDSYEVDAILDKSGDAKTLWIKAEDLMLIKLEERI
jgi:hypothetical protein